MTPGNQAVAAASFSSVADIYYSLPKLHASRMFNSANPFL